MTLPLTGAAELDAAGIEGAALRASYLECRRLNARHGKTYFLATLLLPPAKRPYVHALYGFARHADDLVDEYPQPAEHFDRWSAEVLANLEWGSTSDPVCRALIDTLRHWSIPRSYVAEFLAAMRMDLTVTGYRDYESLQRYMWGSAAVIGLQMLPILGRLDDSVRWDQLEGYAADLGVAFQLTNFLRDVGDDLLRGRVYLPQTSLDQFGVDRQRLARGRVDEPIRNLLAFEIERARALYRRAEPGIALVHPTSQDCLRTAFTLYGEILDEIERNHYDVFSRRVSVGIGRRLQLGAGGATRAWRTRRAGHPAGPTARA